MNEISTLIKVDHDAPTDRLTALSEIFRSTTLPPNLYQIASALTDFGPNEDHTFYVAFRSLLYMRELVLEWFYGPFGVDENMVRVKIDTSGEYTLSTRGVGGTEWFGTRDQMELKKMLMFVFDEGW